MNEPIAKPTHVTARDGKTTLLFDEPPSRVLDFVRSQATNPEWFIGVEIQTYLNQVTRQWVTTVTFSDGKAFQL